MEKKVEEHYGVVAESYMTAHFYKDDKLVGNQLKVAGKLLNLSPESLLVDLGGGSGVFSRALAQNASLKAKPIVVDPSPPMIKLAEDTEGVEAFCGTMDDFMATEKAYDTVLMKEMVHHLPLEIFEPMLKGMLKTMTQEREGRVVIMTRDTHECYPFFEAARRQWDEDLKAPAETYKKALEDVGFKVEVHVDKFLVKLSVGTWFGLLRNRFWSTFRDFTDEEIEAGIEEVRATLPEGKRSDEDDIEFNDEITYILGVAPIGPKPEA